MLTKIRQLLNIKYIDIYYYIQGTFRMFLYIYAPYLLRTHIINQYHERLVKAEECLKKGSCRQCGCKTPDLFFANKPCSMIHLTLANRKALFNTTEICYNKMLSKNQYNKQKSF